MRTQRATTFTKKEISVMLLGSLRCYVKPSGFVFRHSHRLLSSSTRPFRVLGVQQIAIGCENRDPLNALWKDIFGFSVESSHRLESENVEEDILKVGKAPFEVEVDLMCPIDPDKSPKVHKPPLNHIGLWVDDLPQAVDWMTAQGVRFTPGGIRKGAAGHDVIFLHPKGSTEAPLSGNGVLIELVQAPPTVIQAYSEK